jgi:hypothetical protein
VVAITVIIASSKGGWVTILVLVISITDLCAARMDHGIVIITIVPSAAYRLAAVAIHVVKTTCAVRVNAAIRAFVTNLTPLAGTL